MSNFPFILFLTHLELGHSFSG